MTQLNETTTTAIIDLWAAEAGVLAEWQACSVPSKYQDAAEHAADYFHADPEAWEAALLESDPGAILAGRMAWGL